MEKHNHAPDWGRRVGGCPRCEELTRKPYVLTFKLDTDRKIRRVPVASVREATEHVKALLPAGVVRIPIVTTPGGETVAILQVL